MAYKPARRAVLVAGGLFACGAAAGAAWRGGVWGSLAGSVLAAVWLAILNGLAMAGRAPIPVVSTDRPREPLLDRLLLDAAPTPMLAIEHGGVRALNRAARRLFATDDRVLPAPGELLGAHAGHLRYENRQWRIDRVMLGGEESGRTVAALIDVEREERVAEARATAEMIHVLGHELLNGLAPIVSLAESGQAVLDRRDADPVLLREILGTLARRAEGLRRFTASYRELARLPAPRLAPVSITQLADDLSRLFAGRWPGVALAIEVKDSPGWPLDRDQMGQALWALLQNAAEAATSTRGENARVTLTIYFEGANLAFEVRDNGEGVPPESAARIFRPFHTTKPGGTGIGLSLARQIVHAHGGSLTLAPEQRATFLITLLSNRLIADQVSPTRLL